MWEQDVTEPIIRIAIPGDVRSIEAVILDAYGKYVERMGTAPAPMDADYGRLVEEGDVWVLDLDGEVAGLIVLRSKPDHLLIGNVAMSRAYQGRRLGSRLLDHAEAEARRRGHGEMRLFTNEAMHENLAIYARLGWSEYDRAEQDGFRRVFMKKRVPSVQPDA